MTMTKRRRGAIRPLVACVQCGMPAPLGSMFPCFKCDAHCHAGCLIHHKVDAAGDGCTSNENSATLWRRRDRGMSDVDFHDETGNQPGTVSIDVGGHVFTALVDPSISCTVERVFTTIDAACLPAGAPISFTKRELVEPVGVGVKAIGNALQRLRAENRVTTERRGQQYWYHTVSEPTFTEQGQLALGASPSIGRTKPKPRWDVHLPGAGNRGGSLAGVFRPLIAGPSGSAVSPRLSGWTARPGICRPSPAPPPCSPGTDCQWPPLSPSPR